MTAPIQVWAECGECEGAGSYYHAVRFHGEAYGCQVEVDCDRCDGRGGFEVALTCEYCDGQLDGTYCADCEEDTIPEASAVILDLVPRPNGVGGWQVEA